MEYFIVGVAGGLGAISRYGLGLLIKGWHKNIFPFPTFTINITGCFLMGLIMTLAIERSALNPRSRLALTTGFLGGYTTFSTYSYETVNFINQGKIILAIIYAIGSLALGIAGAWLGTVLARKLGDNSNL